MKLLKILLAFILFFSVVSVFTSKAEAQGSKNNMCQAKEDCDDKDLPDCHCQGERDAQGHCLPVDFNALGGICTSNNECDPKNKGADCTADRTICKQVEGKYYCVATPEEVPQIASPWYITKPEDVSNYMQSGDTSVNALSTQLNITTSIASIAINALGGTESNVLGAQTQSNGGATGILTGLVLNMTTKPVISSKEYLADLGHNLGINPVSPAYAQNQGIGFNAFSPVLSLWKIFRDIAYLVMVAIFIVIGLMVMFRKKIDPRTVVTIQDALPRIIVTLILITFSYAIAGLVVDVGEFTTRMIGVTLGQNKLIAVEGGDFQNNILDRILKANVIDLTNQIRIPSKLTKKIAAEKILPDQQSLPGPIAWLAEATLWLAFTIAGFFVMFKIFFALLAPYVSIILSVIFAPLALLLGAIPGSQFSVTSWLRGLIANVAVFPVVFTLLAIAAILKGTNEASFFGGIDWHVVPNTYGLLWSPATIGSFGDVAGMLVAFGILFAIPRTAEHIQHMLGEKPSPLSQAAGEGLTGAITGAPIIGGMIGGFVKK